jgi:hypothetical protein
MTNSPIAISNRTFSRFTQLTLLSNRNLRAMHVPHVREIYRKY